MITAPKINDLGTNIHGLNIFFPIVEDQNFLFLTIDAFFFRIIDLSIRQANAGYLLNSDKANCLTKYDFPFPRFQKQISISRSMIFLFQDIKNHFLFH